MIAYVTLLCLSLGGWVLLTVSRSFKRMVVKHLMKSDFEEKVSCVNRGIEKTGTPEGYIIGNIKKCLLIGALSAITAIVLWFVNNKENVDIPYRIERAAPGIASRELDVNILNKSGENIVNKRIPINSQEYTNEKLDILADKLEAVILMNMLAKNDSVDEVDSNLRFDKSIGGYPFDITYSTDNPKRVSSSGEVNNEEIDASEIIRIRITFSYKEYVRDINQYVRVIPKRYSKKDRLIKDIESSIASYDTLSANSKYLYLPKKVDGVTLRYRIKDTGTNDVVIALGIIVAILIYVKGNKDIDDKYKKRNAQMSEDYLRIVSQYVLYLNAGMNTKRVWDKICEEYEKRIEKGGKKRYAYEEMLICQRSMMEGMGELEAYEGFSKRCALKEYRTFSGLICQVRQKGMDKMSDILNQELNNVKEDRIKAARKRGEDASTKLLFPMLILLSIVIAIVILPAFISFNQGG